MELEASCLRFISKTAPRPGEMELVDCFRTDYSTPRPELFRVHRHLSRAINWLDVATHLVRPSPIKMNLAVVSGLADFATNAPISA